MITALDATAVIYALNPADRPNEADAAALVNAYVDWLKVAQQIEIQIPAPAQSEFLAFYTPDTMLNHIAATVRRGFVVTPFDEECSLRAAELTVRLGGRAFRKRMKQEFDISKQCVKTDIQIVATALVHGAKRIITADGGVAEAARAAGLIVLSPKDCVIPAADAPEASGGRLFDV